MTTYTDHDLATAIAAKLGVTDDFAADAAETYLAQIEQVDGRDIDRDAIAADDYDFALGAATSAQRAGDFGTRELDIVADAAHAVEDADRVLRDAQSTRDRAIRNALAHGARVVDVMTAAGVTRARIDQIRRGTR